MRSRSRRCCENGVVLRGLCAASTRRPSSTDEPLKLNRDRATGDATFTVDLPAEAVAAVHVTR
jgi:hypothetical protein